jgi:hypothetical protein
VARTDDSLHARGSNPNFIARYKFQNNFVSDILACLPCISAASRLVLRGRKGYVIELIAVRQARRQPDSHLLDNRRRPCRPAIPGGKTMHEDSIGRRGISGKPAKRRDWPIRCRGPVTSRNWYNARIVDPFGVDPDSRTLVVGKDSFGRYPLSTMMAWGGLRAICRRTSAGRAMYRPASTARGRERLTTAEGVPMTCCWKSTRTPLPEAGRCNLRARSGLVTMAVRFSRVFRSNLIP